VIPAERVRARLAEAEAIAAALRAEGQAAAAALVTARAAGLGVALAEMAEMAAVAARAPAPAAPPRPAPAPRPDAAPSATPLPPVLGEDREALVRRLWADGTARIPDMLAAVNALPGPPLGSPRRLRALIATLDPPLPPREHWTRRMPEALVAPERNPLMQSVIAAAEARRTPERDALIRELWPQMAITGDAIVERLNALPGAPVTWPWLFHRAEDLGLPGRRAAARAAGLPVSAPSLQRERAETPTRLAREVLWNPPREDALRQGWEAGDPPEAILAAVNALPGPTIPGIKTLTDRASYRKLRRPAAYMAALRERKTATMRAARHGRQELPPAAEAALPEPPPAPVAEPPPAPPPRPAPAPVREVTESEWQADPLGTMAPDEFADAEGIIIVQRRGALAMAEEFGWPLARCQAIAEALRRQRAAA